MVHIDKLKDMYKVKEENVEKLKAYLRKQEELNKEDKNK